MKPGDEFPVAEVYRGVGIHCWQSAARMAVVRADIDAVHALSEPAELFAWAGDQLHSPESRLFAAAKCEATFAMATEARERRPAVNLERLHASVVGLGTLHDADRHYHCSIFDTHPPGPVRAAQRETPLERD